MMVPETATGLARVCARASNVAGWTLTVVAILVGYLLMSGMVPLPKGGCSSAPGMLCFELAANPGAGVAHIDNARAVGEFPSTWVEELQQELDLDNAYFIPVYGVLYAGLACWIGVNGGGRAARWLATGIVMLLAVLLYADYGWENPLLFDAIDGLRAYTVQGFRDAGPPLPDAATFEDLRVAALVKWTAYGLLSLLLGIALLAAMASGEYRGLALPALVSLAAGITIFWGLYGASDPESQRELVVGGFGLGFLVLLTFGLLHLYYQVRRAWRGRRG